MNTLNHLTVLVGRLVASGEGEVHDNFDDQGWHSKSWIWPEKAELIYGTIASVLIIGALVWKAGPFVKKAMAERTERIQKELDEAGQARRDAEAEAARIREALGDIDAERQRLLAEADAQAESLLADGRRRLEQEIADLEAKAEADLATAASRTGDELRAEIARFSSQAIDEVVSRTLDDATQQELIESFISRVGASGGVS